MQGHYNIYATGEWDSANQNSKQNIDVIMWKWHLISNLDCKRDGGQILWTQGKEIKKNYKSIIWIKKYNSLTELEQFFCIRVYMI